MNCERSWRKWRISCLAASAVWVCICGCASRSAFRAEPKQPATTEQILQKVRRALGTEESFREHTGIAVRANTLHYGDLHGWTSQWFGPDGTFVTVTDSPVGDAFAFDGKHGYAQDWSGMPRLLALDELERSLLINWVLGGYWLSQSAPFSIRAGETVDEKTVTLSLKLRGGTMKATLTIDRATWRPILLTRPTSNGDITWRFEEYREFGGLSWPTRIHYADAIGNTSLDTVLYVEPADHSPDRFSRFHSRPDDTRFDPAEPAGLEVKRTWTEHLFVRVKLDNVHDGWFVLDTGAEAMAIDRGLADKLDMPRLGSTLASGTGGVDRVQFRRGKALKVGPLEIERPLYCDFHVSPLVNLILGKRVAGALGYDFFARAIVEMDQSATTVSVHDPKSYELAAGEWQKMVLSGRTPAVEATFEDDHRGWFELDTGANCNVTFNAWVTDEYPALSNRATGRGFGFGFGGIQQSKKGRIECFSFGGIQKHNLAAEFSKATAGTYTNTCTTGTIGGGLLRELKLVLDYPSARMAFIPTKNGGS